MAMMVLSTFTQYSVPDILNLPYMHFILLFEMAESRDALNAISVFYGRCMVHDENFRNDMLEVPRSKLKSEDVFKRIVTPQAKQTIEQLVRGK